MTISAIDAYCESSHSRFVDELVDFCRIASISADPARAADVRRSAEHLAMGARTAGLRNVALIETRGHPAVYADRLVNPALPTVLVYGHHDVQPVEPLHEWLSPPFQPEIRDGRLHCRGAVDDKGQVWMHLKAIEAHLQTGGELPINLKLIVEGEEEIGSVHFEELLTAEKDRLAADVCVVSDTAMHSRGRPSLIIGLRGGAALDIEVSGPSTDLHSGTFGGAVLNPIQALVAMLASLHDPATGRITIPGFYDEVVELSDTERALLAEIPFDEDGFRHEAGDVPDLHGEAGYSTNERATTRPTLEINGIWGGHQGEGTKTIVPARAGAKITCRLVPDQRPDDIRARLEAALKASAPRGVRLRLTPGGRVSPVTTPADHPAIAAAAAALRDVFGAKPLLLRSGGSIAPVEMFARLMSLPAVLLGVGLPDDRIHAPNEKFDLDQFHAGIRVVARLWERLAVALTGAEQR